MTRNNIVGKKIVTVTRGTCCYLTHDYSTMICSHGSHIVNTWSWRQVNIVKVVLNSYSETLIFNHTFEVSTRFTDTENQIIKSGAMKNTIYHVVILLHVILHNFIVDTYI